LSVTPSEPCGPSDGVYAGWALSQAFYREHLYLTLGYESLEDFLVQDWEASFLRRDAANLLSML